MHILGCTTTPPFEEGYQPKAKPSSERIENSRLVVLVHGILGNGQKLSPLTKSLEENGYTCFAPDLKPNNAYHGIEDLALKLEAEVNAHWGQNAEFAIVGFSMGGLVSRYYLQELSGAQRCWALVTISSPHNGTVLAHASPSRGIEEMRPKSELLEKLNSESSLMALQEIPIHSYYTPLDEVIVPARSSELESAHNQRFLSLIHPLMIYKEKVQEKLIEDLNLAFKEKQMGRTNRR
jgi:triacylglycerol lipase